MKKLLFVYNANSGLRNMVLDVAHKIFSPKTYNCNLCALTYDKFAENLIWKEFRKTSKLHFEFLHLDEFKANHPNQDFNFPLILEETNSDLHEFLSAKSINSLNSVEELIIAIKSKI